MPFHHGIERKIKKTVKKAVAKATGKKSKASEPKAKKAHRWPDAKPVPTAKAVPVAPMRKRTSTDYLIGQKPVQAGGKGAKFLPRQDIKDVKPRKRTRREKE